MMGDQLRQMELFPDGVMESEIMFRPVVRYAKLLGIFRPDFHEVNKNGSTVLVKKVLYWILFLVVQMALWGVAAKYVVVLCREQSAGRIITILAILTFHVGTSYMSTATYFTISKNYKRFCNCLTLYQQQHGALRRSAIIYKFIKWDIFLMVVVSMVGTFCYCYMVTGPLQNEFEQIMYPFKFTDPLNTSVTIIIIVLNEIILTSHTSILSIFTIVICYILITEFKHITQGLENVIQNQLGAERPNKYGFEHQIETFRQQHTRLFDVFEAANSMLCHYLFGLYATCLPIICFVLYGIIRGGLTSGELLFVLIIAGLFLGFVTLYTVLGAVLNLKAHEPLDVLMTINLLSVTNKCIQSVSLFTSRLTGSNIGFRIYELFTLDTTAILTLVGTLVTYAVIMLQFSESAESGTQLSRNSNLTCDFK